MLTSIHPTTKEMDLRARCLVLSSHETVSLVDTLRCVDWEYLAHHIRIVVQAIALI